MDPRAAGDLEDLGGTANRALVRVEAPKVAKARPDGRGGVTRWMSTTLTAGAVVFAFGTLVQIVAVVWIACMAALATGAGLILVRTGGLETHTFGTCTVAALIVDVVLGGAIAGAWLTRQMRDTGKPRRVDGVFVRRPAAVICVALAILVALVTAAGWERSVYFPYPLVSIVVLAAAYFYAVTAIVLTGRLVDRSWTPLKRWAHESPYRTGALTATLVLLGAAGFGLREMRWYERPGRRLVAAVEVAKAPRPSGPIQGELEALCLAAHEVSPRVATSGSAPACGFLAGEEGAGAGSSSDCFEEMAPQVPRATEYVRQHYPKIAADAEDIAMTALVETCDDPSSIHHPTSYYFRVVRNAAARAVLWSRRVDACTDWEERADELARDCEAGDTPADLAERRSSIEALAWCSLTDSEKQVISGRLIKDQSFRDLGAQLGLEEEAARWTFHNALKKLRSQVPAGCLRK